MSGSVNRVILVGNLARDPESRSTQDGSKIVNLTLATSERWNDRASGEKKERSEFHRVVIFNDRIGEVAERYLKKGAKIFVDGSLQTRKYTDKEGQEKYTTEIVIGRFKGELTMLDGRSSNQDDQPSQGGRSGAPSPAPTDPSGRKRTYAGEGSDLADDIPF
jgi:single-strand DNA-binding protein